MDSFTLRGAEAISAAQGLAYLLSNIGVSDQRLTAAAGVGKNALTPVRDLANRTWYLPKRSEKLSIATLRQICYGVAATEAVAVQPEELLDLIVTRANGCDVEAKELICWQRHHPTAKGLKPVIDRLARRFTRGRAMVAWSQTFDPAILRPGHVRRAILPTGLTSDANRHVRSYFNSLSRTLALSRSTSCHYHGYISRKALENLRGAVGPFVGSTPSITRGLASHLIDRVMDRWRYDLDVIDEKRPPFADIRNEMGHNVIAVRVIPRRLAIREHSDGSVTTTTQQEEVLRMLDLLLQVRRCAVPGSSISTLFRYYESLRG